MLKANLWETLTPKPLTLAIYMKGEWVAKHDDG